MRPQSAKHDPNQPPNQYDAKPVTPGYVNPVYNNFSHLTHASNSKLRSKYILHDKEQLYDESIKLKDQLHKVQTENMQFKTKMQQYEKEIVRKNKEINEIYDQFQSQMPSRLLRAKNESHLITVLKKQLKDLKTEKKERDDEMLAFKKKTKITKLQEMEVEMKMYIDECTRLRHLLEEVIQQNGALGQEDMNAIEQKFAEQANILKQIKQENTQLQQRSKAIETELAKAKGNANPRRSDNVELQNAKKQAESYKKEIENLKKQISIDSEALLKKAEHLTENNKGLMNRLEYNVT